MSARKLGYSRADLRAEAKRARILGPRPRITLREALDRLQAGFRSLRYADWAVEYASTTGQLPAHIYDGAMTGASGD